jgi:hypothetical protein
LPVAVILKRFLAPDLVLSLGIWLKSPLGGTHGKWTAGRSGTPAPVLLQAKRTATAALEPGGSKPRLIRKASRKARARVRMRVRHLA